MTAAAQAIDTPFSTLPAAEPATFRPAPTDAVGQPLTDESREEAIKQAGALMLRKHADFARTGYMADLGDAHRALLLQNRLIAGRSHEMVRRLEIKRGLI